MEAREGNERVMDEKEIDKKELEYIYVLKALKEIPFAIGKELLIDFLQGKDTNKSIVRNKLSSLSSFGSLAYQNDELHELIDNLIINKMIEVTSLPNNKFWKVLELTVNGRAEIEAPSLYKRKVAFNFKQKETFISEEDKKLFANFKDFLESYNDPQKKAIISNQKQILCIAGAGSGKTTVLTKRIEFVVKYRSVAPHKILAITFTRKARAEMLKRLSNIEELKEVKIETFNSFCEKILMKHNDHIYQQAVRVITYGDKISIINKALSTLGMDINRVIAVYFTVAQQRGKTLEQLANIFMNDCFFIRDYFKFKNKPLNQLSFNTNAQSNELSTKVVFAVCNYIEAYIKKNGLRDFTDQLMDTIKLFEESKDFIPKFDYVLVDEYQDVNSAQIRLIDLLNPENIFCVGDPRQSIFGWRGSDIKYILNFEEKYPDCSIITLTKNYRSVKSIVNFINDSIRKMGLADLDSSIEGEGNIKIHKFSSEEQESNFVLQQILASNIPRKEIFVLARTNKLLAEFSPLLKAHAIKHIIRNDENRKEIIAGEEEITLATIHSIKGLEAEQVFVIGCTMQNFPCKGSEHPIIEMVKVDEYDKEEEERRLFYVAISRAKKSLFLTYSTQKPTYFINENMLKWVKNIETDSIVIPTTPTAKVKFTQNNQLDIATKLRNWRWNISQERNLPAYMIINNQTLADIVQKKPLTLDDLEDVHGLGPIKIMKYGEEILNLVNS